MAVHENLTVVALASTGAEIDSFQCERVIALPLSDVVTVLRKTIELADMWVLHEIDPQALLRKGGYAIPGARQILFFHPRLMARLLSAEAAAILEVPLKYALVEEPDGSVRLRWLRPGPAFARYGSAALAELGNELERMCVQIADALPGQSAVGSAVHELPVLV